MTIQLIQKSIQSVHNKGMTVVELLVSLAIISLLVILTASGTLSVRESARLITCQNHFHQIALANESYTATHGVFACSGLLGQRYLADHLGGKPGAWVAPTGYFDPCVSSSCPEYGDWSRPAAYLCPSDAWASGAQRVVSLRFNSGQYELLRMSPGASSGSDLGDQQRRHMIAPRDVTDGLSNTALASEQLLGVPAIAQTAIEVLTPIELSAARQEPLRYHFEVDRLYDLSTDEEFAAWTAACELAIGRVDHHQASYGGFTSRVITYGHTQTPNRRSCFPHNLSTTTAIFPPTSAHRGGVTVAFLDGRTRFVADSIDLRVWRALGTRAGHESVGIDD